ncbi:Hypothetical_protein [Hexamita inflata]|uniref:Hypothetical_protein n=1 Tax=Hexamita inflata TaxID=28002 RepID=A0AA86UG88_9EUKA|nr:Hypothetical protein HINF_LOCUS44595 [Hexamita inflata]CAI9956953.1 Hypothetical protein HINF_LOCUS44598 [Hexamita inflata]
MTSNNSVKISTGALIHILNNSICESKDLSIESFDVWVTQSYVFGSGKVCAIISNFSKLNISQVVLNVTVYSQYSENIFSQFGIFGLVQSGTLQIDNLKHIYTSFNGTFNYHGLIGNLSNDYASINNVIIYSFINTTGTCNAALIGYQRSQNWSVSNIFVNNSVIIGTNFSGIICAHTFNKGLLSNILITLCDIQANSSGHSYSGGVLGYIFSSLTTNTSIYIENTKLYSNNISSTASNETSYDTHSGAITAEQKRETIIHIINAKIEQCILVANSACRKAFSGGYIGLTYGQVFLNNSQILFSSLQAMASNNSIAGSVFAMINSNFSQIIQNSLVNNINVTSNSLNTSYTGGFIAYTNSTQVIAIVNSTLENYISQSTGLMVFDYMIINIEGDVQISQIQLNSCYSAGSNILNGIQINSCQLVTITTQDGCLPSN